MSNSARVPSAHSVIDHQVECATKSLTTINAVQFFITCFIGYLLLIGLTDLPRVSIFAVDLFFSLYLSSIFGQKVRYIFLLHPFILVISSQFFTVPFLQLGDGPDYRVVVDQYIGPAGLDGIFESFSMLNAFKYMSLGVAPTFAIPDYLYVSSESDVYYIWQGCFHVILVAACVTLSKAWRVIQDDHLLSIALFAVVSPSFFDLGVAPTRHIVTFIAVFLFYISFVALNQRFSIYRLTGLLVAVALIIISKFPLIIPIIIFCVYYSFFEQGHVSIFKKLLVVLALIGAIGLGYGEFLAKIIEYSEISSTGAATFSGLVSIPVLGMFFKYLYALLAPFPWQHARSYIETIYGGNEFLFVMHMLSSLSGIYFFLRLVLYGKPLLLNYPEIRPLIIFGLIMSTSIIFGATGFHTYLLIYFPFFAPLLTCKRYRLSFMSPFVFVIFVETVYTIASL